MTSISPKYLRFILRSLPNFMWPVRWFILRASLKKVGKNFRFGYNSEFVDHRLIEVGNDVFMGLDTTINTTVPVQIHDNVMFGKRVTIMGGDHNISKVGTPMRFVKTGGKNVPIVIEKNAWIGSNVTVLKGVKIGEGAVVGAGSVVVKSIPAYAVAVGNPAKPLKLRFTEAELIEHLSAIGSDYSAEQIVSQFKLATAK